MDIEVYKKEYQSKFCIMGDLDVQTTLGFGDLDSVKRAIDLFITFSIVVNPPFMKCNYPQVYGWLEFVVRDANFCSLRNL